MSAAHELIAFGPVEEDARKQLDRCLDAGGEEARGVLCADHHKGYSMPIGGVLASQSIVMPAGVGYDIACGNCAVRTNLQASDLDVKDVMDEILEHDLVRHRTKERRAGSRRRCVRCDRAQSGAAAARRFSTRRGRSSAPSEAATIMSTCWKIARTVGCGLACIRIPWLRPQDRVRFSRAGERKEMGQPRQRQHGRVALNDSARDAIGRRLSRRDAHRRRVRVRRPRWVVNRVLRMLGARDEQRVHNHHNFAWWEQHDNQRGWSSARARHPHFRDSSGSSADRWATMR